VRSAMITEKGGVPVLVDLTPPQEREGATIVHVDVAAIGPSDLARAEGTFRPFSGPHAINGEGIGRLDDGTRVYFFHSVPPYGGLAERTLVPSDMVWPIADDLSEEDGTVIGSSGTAALASLETARVIPGDRVLVLGATGIVGQVGLQLARAMGAGFVAAAGRDQTMLDRLEAEGLADATAQIGQGDDISALTAIAGPGWDVVLDVIFGQPAEAALKTSAKGARIVTMGRLGGETITIRATDLGSRSIASVGTNDMSGSERRAAYDRLSALLLEGRLKTRTNVFALDQIAQAWDALRSSAHAKVVVRVRG
jgi:NADPH2:quinone reductase